MLSPIGTPYNYMERKTPKNRPEPRHNIIPFSTEKKGFGYKVSFEETIPNKVTLTTSEIEKLIGEQPYPLLSTLWDYKLMTPQLETIITYETDMIVGTDLNINSDDDEIKELLENWATDISLYEKIKSHTSLSLACGFGLFVRVRKGKELINIEEFDVRTITKAFRDTYGNVIAYEQRISSDGKTVFYFVGNGDINGYNGMGSEKIKIDGIPLIFKQNGRSAFGLSEYHSLAIPRQVGNRTSRPLAEALWSLDDVVIGTLENFAYPTEYHVFEGANDDDLLAEAQKLKDSKPGDKFILSRMHEIDRREPTQAKFDAFIGHFGDVLQHGTGFPLDMLTGDFASRASSQTADSFFMRKIRSYQKSLTKLIKREFLEEKLRSLGMDESRIKKANITCEFEVQSNKDYTPEIVQARGTGGFWTKDEVREYDKANGQDLFDDDAIKKQDADNKVIQMAKQQDPTIDLKKKIESLEKQIPRPISESILKRQEEIKEKFYMDTVDKAIKEALKGAVNEIKETVEDKKFNKKIKTDILEKLNKLSGDSNGT